MRIPCLIVLVLCSAGVFGLESESGLPRLWVGSYFPHDEQDEDFYHIEIENVEVGERVIRANGRGKFFDDGSTTDIEITWEIEKESRFIRMQDLAPVDANYDSNGLYTGAISSDFRTIVATWRNWANNDSGTVRLRAVDKFPVLAGGPPAEVPGVGFETGDSIHVESIRVHLNPSRFAPLTAMLDVELSAPFSLAWRVIGKRSPLDDVGSKTGKRAIAHQIPVLGLYAAHINRVELSVMETDGSVVETLQVEIPTPPPIPALPAIRINTSNTDEMLPGMTLVSSYGHTEDRELVPMRAFIFDAYGEVRWFMDPIGHSELGRLFYNCGPERLANGNLYFGNANSDAIYEMNMLGDIVNVWRLDGYKFHHQVIEKPDGNFIATVTKKNIDTRQDFVIEIAREDARLVTEWNLNLSLQNSRTTWGNDQKNWFHGNAVVYDERSDSILVSGRYQGVAKLDRENQLVWAMSPHKGWTENGRGVDMQERLLKPVDNSGELINVEAVLSGDENHPDFEWNWYQHAPQILPNGNIMLFDNGDKRNYREEEIYSRAVEYRVDDSKRTIQQVWQYGKERGEDLYARIVSDVDYYPAERRVIMSSGSAMKNDNPAGRVVEFDYDSGEVFFDAVVMPEKAPFGVSFHRTERITLYPGSP